MACLLFYTFQDRLLYKPTYERVGTPAERGLPFHEIALITDDGVQLHAWFVPADSATITVLYLHGNGGNISDRLETLEGFHGLRANIFMLDYRGYGQSTGTPSEAGTYEDADTAWRYLTTELEIPAAQIIIYGRSLGGAIAARLASDRPHAGLILESTFTSLPVLGQKIYPYFPVRLLARFHYDTAGHLARVPTPVMIVHSRSDEVVPFEHARTLLDVVRGDKELLEIHGPHNVAFYSKGKHYEQALRTFFDRVAQAATPA